ncbi:MAG TPA: hypothetical protein VG796_16285 [Verrucomicrobiales bacterium]|jgi:hypothetical protein|nr:hypothetical protein [Verrucomicrobiales bacterium]
MKNFIIIANDADACGNTTLTALLHGYLQRKGLRQTLALTSPEQELPMDTVLLDVEDGFAPQEVVDLVDRSQVVIVDVHTGGAERFEKHFFRHRLDEALDEIECGVTVILPICDDAVVIQNAQERARAWNKCGEVIIARLPLLADDPLPYSGSPAEKYFTQLGATELILPAVNDCILDEIDAMDLDVPLALTQRQHLTRFVRNELLAWEVSACEVLREVESLLVPATSRADDTRDDAIFGKSLAF